jgi:lipopolysaccharide/colanic/teichoic acid biosynthesis glycosyltransferase
MRKRLFYLFDLLIVALSPFVAVFLRNNFTPSSQQLMDIVPFSILGLCIAAIVFILAGTHRGIWRYVSLPDFSRIAIATTITILLALFVVFSINRLDGIARSIPLIQWALIVAGMISARIFARAVFARKTVKSTRSTDAEREHVLVVGLNHVAELYLRCVASLASNKLIIAGLLDETARMKGRLLHHHKVLGQPEELSQILALLNIHGINIKRVVITMPFQELSQPSRDELLKLERSNVIKLDMFEERLGFTDTFGNDKSATRPDIGLERLSGQFADEEKSVLGPKGHPLIKRAIDIMGTLVLVVIFLPITLLVSLLVALDVGLPLTFWQERPGKGGHPFRVYKFRTMMPAHDMAGNRIPDEKRQSKLGCFLRRTRFDELPQLYNILVGEMSFVGPRPLLPIDQPEGINPRLSVRPGLTGWAQVNGGKEVSVEDKAVLDMWYIRNVSLALDFKIILRTIDMVIRGERFNEEAVKAAYKDLGLSREEAPHQKVEKQERNKQIELDNTVILQGVRETA